MKEKKDDDSDKRERVLKGERNRVKRRERKEIDR